MGSVTTYWWDIGTIGTRTPTIRAICRGVHAAAVDDDLALDVAAVGPHPGHPPAVPALLGVDAEHPGAGGDPDAARAGAGRERVRQLRRVDLPVRRQEAAADDAVGVDEREELGDLLRGDLLQRQPVGARPADLPADLLQPLRRGRDLDAAALGPPRRGVPGLQPTVELDRVHVHPGQRRVGAQLADEAGGVERRTRGELGALDEQHVPLAPLRQVVGDAGAADPAAHHDDAGALRQVLAARRRDHPRTVGQSAAATDPRPRAPCEPWFPSSPGHDTTQVDTAGGSGPHPPPGPSIRPPDQK